MKIAFFSSEIFPFAKTGGLADVIGGLPIALEHFDVESVMFMPYYKCVKETGLKISRIADGLLTAKIGKNIDAYFIENDHYFNREGLYGEGCGDYTDNLERFNFYCLKALEAIKTLDLKVDVIHCHDWQTSLVPVYLKEKFKQDPFYKDIKIFQTIHNLSFQGIFPKEKWKILDFSEELSGGDPFEFFGKINLLKAGISYSDEVSTVSKQYAKEIQTKEFGCGLENVFLNRNSKIIGIVNGVDYSFWNPERDDLIFEKFSFENYSEKKLKNKLKLQEELGLSMDEDTPVFGSVGRLSHQKGLDLLESFLLKIKDLDIQVIVQGVGNEGYANKLKKVANKCTEKIKVVFAFGEHIAHQIYAGSDFFLMPSVFEPCGLSQLIAMKYGTIPIVYRTGGFIDTVIPLSEDQENANGLMFETYDTESLFDAVTKAKDLFSQKQLLELLIRNALNSDFSWDKSAQEYIKIYQSLVG